MKVGVTFPQTEIGTDPGAIRAYAQAVEEMGLSHILAYDHVLGADDRGQYSHRQGRPYNYASQFLEPFILFAHLAAVTTTLEFVTGVIILSQRQTALVAKQAAVLDVLSGGRFRLGIGTGWNEVEYEALGENMGNRGKRSEEQIEVMRALWTNEVVTYEGRWHKITAAGINPLPVQRPIPVWFGGGSEPVLERIGRMGDGWIAIGMGADAPDPASAKIERIRQYAKDAGRNPDDVGIEGRSALARASLDECVSQAKDWEKLGAHYTTLVTMDAGLKTPDDHIEVIRQFKEALDG
jgi:probable F420-dependent oxidoreductase